MGKSVKVDELSIEDLYQYVWEQWQVEELLLNTIEQLAMVIERTGSTVVAQLGEAFVRHLETDLPKMHKALQLDFGVWRSYMFPSKRVKAETRKKLMSHLASNEKLRDDVAKALDTAQKAIKKR